MTVTLGNLIQTVVFVIGLIVAYGKFTARLAHIETRLGPLWDEYTERRKTRRRRSDNA